MRILPWDYIFWGSAIVLQLLILFVVLWRRILPQLWGFHLYLLFNIIRSSILMTYIPHLTPLEHTVLYWRINSIGYIFQAGLAAQIAMQCVKRPLSTAVFLFAEATAIIELCMIFSANEMTTEPLVTLNTLAAMICMGIILMALLINSMSWPCGGLAWGMVSIMLGEIIAGLYRIVFGVWNHWETVRRVIPAVSILTLLYWLIVVSFGEEHKKLKWKALARRVG